MDRPVTIADAEIADRIARSVRDGGPAERSPTVEQLLLAFGETKITPQAAERVAAALDVAGVSVSPPLAKAQPAARLALSVGGPKRGRWRAAGAAAVLGLVVGGAALAATLTDDDGGQRVTDRLPDQTTATMTTPTTPEVTVPPATTSSTTATTTTPKAKAKAKRKPKPASRGVSVVLIPAQPTFVCVEDRTGRVLFSGTLSQRRRFGPPFCASTSGLPPRASSSTASRIPCRDRRRGSR